MATLDDQASDQEEFIRTCELSFRKPELKHTGLCYNCDSVIPGVFCDHDCEHDYERRKENNKRGD